METPEAAEATAWDPELTGGVPPVECPWTTSARDDEEPRAGLLPEPGERDPLN